MDFLFFDDLRKKPFLGPVLIATSSIAIFILNGYGLIYGITYVLPHLFYIPIIITAYYYPRRGVLFALGLSILYCAVSFTLVTPTMAEMLSATARSGVFIIIAGVVSFLSERMHHDTQMCRRLVSVVKSSGDAIVSETLDGIVTDWNTGAENLYGYTAREIEGSSIFRLIPPEWHTQKYFMLEKIRKGEIIERVETERITKDGTKKQVSLAHSPVFDSRGEIVGVSSIAHDITEKKKMEAALQESETKFRKIFDAANDGIHLHEMRKDGLPGKFVDVNEVACRMLRYSKEELLETSPLDFTTDYHSRPLEQIGEEIKTKGFAIFETEHRRKDGIIVPVEVNAHVVFLQGRNMVLSVIRDLTRRKRDEAALKESEKKYRTLFESMLEGFAYCRMIYNDRGEPFDWVYLAVNNAFRQMTGLEDITGKRVLEAIPDIRELTPEIFETYGRVASTGTPETFDIDFKPLKMWMRISVFSPEKGYFVAIFTDISEHKRAEDEIRKARDFYLKVLDDFPNPIWRADVHAKCDYFNQDWLLFTGRTLEQELGDGWAEGVHPDDLDRCLKIYLDNFHAKKSFEMEYRLRYHDGTYHWLYDSGKPFYTIEGEFAGYIGSCYDIQARRLAEDALRVANNKLNLLSSITRHDIKNQLMALNAYIELSSDAVENPVELRGFIAKEQKIADAIARQITFTKDYEDLGMQSPAWQNVSVLVRDAGTALPMKDIILEMQQSDLEVFGDPLLGKVFYNLIDNSLHYGGEKMTAIHVTADEGSDGLRIVYEDDGTGISADDKKKLFTKGFGKHTGLGLYLSREILSLTGITITETGEPGKGVRFEITVPKGAYRFT